MRKHFEWNYKMSFKKKKGNNTIKVFNTITTVSNLVKHYKIIMAQYIYNLQNDWDTKEYGTGHVRLHMI